jgi:hypothetical protein
MAFGTILPEFIGMWIFMAIGAIGSFNAFELLEFYPVFDRSFMTISASNLFMFTRQYKFCFVVIELSCRFKFLVVMAIGTIYRKRFLMVISMTGQAFRF